MPRSFRSLRLGVLAVLAITITLLSPMSADAAAPPPPATGACYNYGWSTYLGTSNTSTRVDCATSHTARTVLVGRLWTTEAYSTMLNDQKIAIYMDKQCQIPAQRAIGTWTSVATSGYQLSLFVPTMAQYDAGARWFTCDVVLPGINRLYPIPNTPQLAVPLSPGRVKCLHLSSQGAGAVACAAPHSYRAAGVAAASGTTYPSRAAWLALGQAHCRAITRSSSWYVTWPSSIRWAAGDHLLTCYRPTTA